MFCSKVVKFKAEFCGSMYQLKVLFNLCVVFQRSSGSIRMDYGFECSLGCMVKSALVMNSI